MNATNETKVFMNATHSCLTMEIQLLCIFSFFFSSSVERFGGKSPLLLQPSHPGQLGLLELSAAFTYSLERVMARNR